MTVRQLITRSLRIIGQLKPGRGPNNSELTTGLEVANAMLESWSTERLNIPVVERDAYTLTGATGSYTLGPGGDFDAARPVYIEAAGILLTDQTTPPEVPLEVYRDARKWAAVRSKSTAASIPEVLYPEMGLALVTLNLYPVPDTAHDLVLYAWNVLTSFGSLDDELSFPPGYVDALSYNLAVRLAPEWGLPLQSPVPELALQTLGAVKRINTPLLEMTMDPALVGRSGIDIETGRTER